MKGLQGEEQRKKTISDPRHGVPSVSGGNLPSPGSPQTGRGGKPERGSWALGDAKLNNHRRVGREGNRGRKITCWRNLMKGKKPRTALEG